MTERFELGEIVITPGAVKALGGLEASAWESARLLARHHAGDWGEEEPSSAEANDENVRLGGSLISSYTVNETRIQIVTVAERTITTIFLPSEAHTSGIEIP